MKDGRWTRREFLRAAGGAAGTIAAASLVTIAGEAAGGMAAADRKPGGPAVAVASGEDAAANVLRAVAAIGGIGAFVSRGDVVVVKPNIGWDRTPEQAADTSPEVVVAVAQMCLSAGAKEVRIFDRPCNEPRRSYASSGIQEAVQAFARKHGVADALRIYHVEGRKFRRTSIPGALSLKEWDFYQDALEADGIINVPIAKHHSLATVTLGLKNMMGVIGGNRGQIHFRLAECLTDIHRRLPSRLTVIDAARVLVRNGPTGGDLADVRKVGKIFASADVVAADVVAAERIFGWKPGDVPHIRKALESGLGTTSPKQIRVVEA